MQRTYIVIIGFIALVGFLIWRFPDALHEDNTLRLVSLVAILAYLGVGLTSRKYSFSHLMKGFGAWIGIGLVILFGYSYRDEAYNIYQRLHATILPFQGIRHADGSISFPASDHGHFVVEASIRGTSIRMMVDTGASRIVLTASDARRLGIDTQRLRYDQRSNTANGQVWSAPITLRQVKIGPIRVTNVQASVSKSDLNQSLLGMSFLERIKSYEVINDVLTLRN